MYQISHCYLLGALTMLQKRLLLLLCLSVHFCADMQQIGFSWMDFCETLCSRLFQTMSRLTKFVYYRIQVAGTLDDGLRRFMIICC